MHYYLFSLAIVVSIFMIYIDLASNRQYSFISSLLASFISTFVFLELLGYSKKHALGSD